MRLERIAIEALQLHNRQVKVEPLESVVVLNRINSITISSMTGAARKDLAFSNVDIQA